MIKPDEITFLILMQLRCRVIGDPDGGETPRAIIADSTHLLPAKRAEYLLQKWVGKGWYDYGTTLDMGWMTHAGMIASYEKQWNHQQQT